MNGTRSGGRSNKTARSIRPRLDPSDFSIKDRVLLFFEGWRRKQGRRLDSKVHFLWTRILYPTHTPPEVPFRRSPGTGGRNALVTEPPGVAVTFQGVYEGICYGIWPQRGTWSEQRPHWIIYGHRSDNFLVTEKRETLSLSNGERREKRRTQ